jgi:hypothetical protein
MPNYLKLMRSIKEPPNRHYHWSAYNDPKVIQARKLDGYDFVTGKEVMGNQPKKRGRFDPGTVYVSEEGLVRLGDMVLMQTSKENWTRRLEERKEASRKRKDYAAHGGELAGNPHKTHTRYRRTESKLPPQDQQIKGEN